MIIKLTVKDNDFTHIIENYLSNIYSNIMCDLHEDAIEYMHHDVEIRTILNPNCSEAWTREQEEIIIKRIKESFAYYSKNDNYLISKFEVSICTTFEDKWENGESVYWLQHSNNVITQ